MIEDVATASILVAIAISEDQEATEVLEGTVIEKKLSDLLSLLESHAGDTILEILVVLRPLTHALPPST